MDDDERIHRFFGEPSSDHLAQARARARLIQHIQADGSSRGRQRRALVLAAALVALTLLLSVVTLSPFGGASAAAAELRALGAISARASAIQPAPGQFLRWGTQTQRPVVRTDVATGTEFSLVSRSKIETWIAADGTGFQRTEVLSSEFATEADREAWLEIGRPEISGPGEIRVAQFDAGGSPWVDLTGLPTEPAALADAIKEGVPTPLPTGEEVFSRIGFLLAHGNAGPELRAALFEVAARLDGVLSVGEVTDPLGRAGVGFDLEAGGERTRLIFDPASSQLLAIELYDSGDGAPSSWLTSEPASVVDEGPPRQGRGSP